MISPDEWRVVSPHLDALLEQDEAGQQVYLAELNASDPALAQRIEAMLRDGSRPERGGMLDAGLGVLPLQSDATGAVCGPYILTDLIGRGGMGSVWKGHRRDGQYESTVAVKLLAGALHDPGRERRFRREGQILARLVHPNIAHLLDAGITTDAQPYLVLELVDGVHIDAWVRERGLDARATVKLFLRVLAAVAHAHANLVVHRDLKPSNILVDADGNVKLLDFGIAKLLAGDTDSEPATQLTADGARLLTPRYASPEQVRGQEITTATDIYALGVLLFELLTGASPYRVVRDSRAALEEAIITADPRRPSDAASERTAQRSLRGDLDTILLKALRKQPDQRYDTVTALREDLEAWLDARPVRAQPDSLGYTLSRFVRRHTLAVGAAAAVLVAVIGGAGAALWQAREARAAQQRAEEVTRLITGIFSEADPNVGEGKVLSAAELLTQANTRLTQSLQSRPELRLELQSLIGTSLASLQSYDDAEPILTAALAESERLHGPTDDKTIEALLGMSNLHRARGRLDAMDSVLTRVRTALDAQRRPNPSLKVGLLIDQVHLALDRGQPADAIAPAREARALADAALPSMHELRTSSAQMLAVALQQDARDLPAAITATDEALRRTTARYGGSVLNPRVIEGQLALGQVLGRVGQFTRGIEVLQRADSGAVQALGAENFMRAFIRGALGFLHLEQGAEAAAADDYADALRLLRVNGDSAGPSVAITQGNRGLALLRLHRAAEALPMLQASLRGVIAAMGPAAPRVLPTRIRIALAEARAGRLAAARASLRALEPVVSDTTKARPAVRSSYLQASAEVTRLEGRPRDAIPLLRAALALLPDSAKAARAGVEADLGVAQAAAGDATAALATLTRAVAQIRVPEGAMSGAEADARLELGRLQLAAGQAAEGRRNVADAATFWAANAPGSTRDRAARAIAAERGAQP